MDTEAYERYAVQRDGSFRRMAKSGGFVSDYAGSSPAEMAADTFGYLFSGDAASVQRSDRVWSEQFGDLLQRGRGLGASCFDVASPGAPSKAGAALTLDGAPVYQRGVASWYGPGFHGRPTASGQRFNRYGMTAAHPSLPLGSRITVVNLGNGRSVDVVVNDRGPFVGGRVLDLSEGAAEQLGFKRAGTARVEIRFRF
ncbi:MAG: septal ring lytic transglycosylase RlpA family protein [Armatimonadetes bacterium]|nr:septal ring lytic transglycosylase RlpA family protein [Armatimonadota bacterium]